MNIKEAVSLIKYEVNTRVVDRNVREALNMLIAEVEKPFPTDEQIKERGFLTYRVMLRQLNCGFTKDKVTFSMKELRHWFETGQHLKEWKEWDTF